MRIFLIRFYAGLISVGNSLQSPMLLLIRLFWGGSFIKTGLGKLLNIAPIIDYFTSLGIPFPALNAHIASSIEFIGGACLVVGFASRLAAIPLTFVMIIAFLTADIEAVQTIFSDPHYFTHRTPFNFLFASLLIFIFGPGYLSVDGWLKKKFAPESTPKKMD